MILRDVSRIDDITPISTDESLFEISQIKDNIISMILTAIKESAVDCSLYASNKSDEKLVCYGFGNVKTNAYSSYPTLERDLGEKDDVRTEKLTLFDITISNTKYKFDKKNNEIYELSDYDSYKKTGEQILPIGKLSRTGKGAVVDFY